ncbi:DUF1064 domain-containing protein [Nicoliella lavandulae]|uniref:DUF1064 domain-containing protein n=1 Tax=Nicoliella lavandulae TaxID=3082954 RepID=A0ABU8SMN5_9LACO
MKYPDGRPAIKHISRKRKTKYNNKKVTIDGLTFDSQAEARYWYTCKQAYLGNKQVEIKYHEAFEIVPAYQIGSKKHAARKYTPDFTVYDKGMLIKVIDVKGGKATMTDGSSMRINLFMYRYKMPVTIAKWNRNTKKFDEEDR